MDTVLAQYRHVCRGYAAAPHCIAEYPPSLGLNVSGASNGMRYFAAHRSTVAHSETTVCGLLAGLEISKGCDVTMPLLLVMFEVLLDLLDAANDSPPPFPPSRQYIITAHVSFRHTWQTCRFGLKLSEGGNDLGIGVAGIN